MDFIKNKIVLRSIFASISPVLLYTAGFHIAKATSAVFTAEYWNMSAWAAIAAMSILYPLNQISLWMFFKPIEYVLYRNLKVDVNHNPILKGNFKPVNEESSYEVAKILEGAVPTDINGVYLRNGPNAKFLPDNKRFHWFDGDSMIHALRIKDGKMFYCNRYAKTPKLLNELK